MSFLMFYMQLKFETSALFLYNWHDTRTIKPNTNFLAKYYIIGLTTLIIFELLNFITWSMVERSYSKDASMRFTISLYNDDLISW